MTETIVFKKKPLDISLYLYIIMVTIIIINDCHPDAGGIFKEGETGMKTLKYSRQRESIKNCLMNRTDHSHCRRPLPFHPRGISKYQPGNGLQELKALVRAGRNSEIFLRGRF